MKQSRDIWILTTPPFGFRALIGMPQQSTDHVGAVQFPLSCRAERQAAFNRVMFLLHGARVEESRNGFAVLTETDPECAKAYWGAACPGSGVSRQSQSRVVSAFRNAVFRVTGPA